MTILDDVCNFPKGTDDKFRYVCLFAPPCALCHPALAHIFLYSEKLLGAFPSHAHLAATSQPDEFVVKHYAGDVRQSTPLPSQHQASTMLRSLMI
jgi:hypothetical protein